jgi:hypothetical protein
MGRRRDAWAYGLVGLDVVAVLVLWPVMLLDGFAPLDVGGWWLLHPAVLVLVGFLGFWMWGREWLVGQAHQRTPRSLQLVKWASALVLMPLCFYALLALYVVSFDGSLRPRRKWGGPAWLRGVNRTRTSHQACLLRAPTGAVGGVSGDRVGLLR